MAAKVSMVIDHDARKFLSVGYDAIVKMTFNSKIHVSEIQDRLRFMELVDLYICHSYLRYVLNFDVGFPEGAWRLLCRYLAKYYTYLMSFGLWWARQPLLNLQQLQKRTGDHIKVVASYPDGYPRKHKDIASRMADIKREEQKQNRAEGLFGFFDTSSEPSCISSEA